MKTDVQIQTKPAKPKRLLTQNSELKPLGIWNFTHA